MPTLAYNFRQFTRQPEIIHHVIFGGRWQVNAIKGKPINTLFEALEIALTIFRLFPVTAADAPAMYYTHSFGLLRNLIIFHTTGI